jgi:hypothetical protein
MTKAQLETYRTAFARFVACAASRREPAACGEGWRTDAAPLLDGADPKLVAAMADYYVREVLRGDEARRTALCR